VNPAGQSDRIEVTGDAQILGGTVQVAPEQGSYSQNTDYTLLHAGGTLTGTFDEVTSSSAFLDPTLTYTTRDVVLSLARNQTTFDDVAQTPNQKAVAGAMDAASTTASGDAWTVIDALSTLSAAGARSAFDQMAGATYTAFPLVDAETTYRHLRMLFRGSQETLPDRDVSQAGAHPFQVSASAQDGGSGVCPPAWTRQDFGPWGLWMGGLVAYGRRDGDDPASRFDHDTEGATFGLDYAFSKAIRAGVNLGCSRTRIDFDGLPDDGEIDTCQVALYGLYQAEPVAVNGAIYYGCNQYEMTRNVAFASVDRRATGDHRGHDVAAYLEGGTQAQVRGLWVRPLVSLFALCHNQKGFSEQGADSIDLDVDSQRAWSIKGALGLSVTREFGHKETVLYRPEASLRWVHEFGDNRYDVTARFADVPAGAFTVRSDEMSRDSALIGLGLTAFCDTDTQLVLFYDASLSQDYVAHALIASVRYLW
jgi:outer membrane autotransporter protein